MTTKLLQSILVTGACLGFAIPQAEGGAPDAVTSMTVEFTGTVKFTYIVKEGNAASKPATVKLVVN